MSAEYLSFDLFILSFFIRRRVEKNIASIRSNRSHESGINDKFSSKYIYAGRT